MNFSQKSIFFWFFEFFGIRFFWIFLVRTRLRELEDYSLAARMQQAEATDHFQRNRAQRQTAGVDRRLTRAEQESEERRTAEVEAKMWGAFLRHFLLIF
jgi:hypothetical protein